ncbi:MAG TPA: hypothetical protein VGD98_16690 [Ktedonobacteraceae bacterium]
MQQRNPRIARDMTILGGWLFADLLLGLVVIFMATQPPIPKTLVPTPSPITLVTPTPTLPPHLERGFVHLPIPNVDYNGILSNSASAVHYVKNFINSQSRLQGREAGLVIISDGALSDPDIDIALKVGKAMMSNVLQPMGKQTLLFKLTSYYGPLYTFGQDHSIVTLDIYLFAQ